MNPEQLTTLYWSLLISGVLLLGIEIFLPGGIVGAIGLLAAVGAMLLGFTVFSWRGGLLSAALIIIGIGLFVALLLKVFPGTRMGRRLTLEADGRQVKSGNAAMKDLVGAEGVALSILRPSGMAVIQGRRRDVMAEGAWIDPGTPVRVVGVHGNTLMVRPLAPPTAPPPKPS